MKKEKNNILSEVCKGLLIGVGTTLLNDGIKTVMAYKRSIIDLGEWDNAYNNVNKIIYDLDKDKFQKYRCPDNRDIFSLSNNIIYKVKIDHDNYIKVETYKATNESKYYPEQRLKISFFGKDKYKNRSLFIKKAMSMKDKSHIEVKFVGGDIRSTNKIMPRKWENVVIDKNEKLKLINGLKNWYTDKNWYYEHELIHKIGVFLKGKGGTGKSTTVRAISTMFKNAPILTLDLTKPMNSVDEIIKFRNKYDGVMIVLLEDFDMFFKDRESIEKMNNDEKKQMDMCQNIIFQVLDGVYSTDDTIYIATTNHPEKLDKALIRYGRFDIQIEMEYIEYDKALEIIKLFGYDENVLNKMNFDFPIEPSKLQSKIMEYRTLQNIKSH